MYGGRFEFVATEGYTWIVDLLELGLKCLNILMDTQTNMAAFALCLSYAFCFCFTLVSRVEI